MSNLRGRRIREKALISRRAQSCQALLVAILLVAMAVPAPAAHSASLAGDERSMSDPTAWWWLTGVTPAYVSQFVTDNGARIVDIEVEQVSPSMLLSVALVKNSGAYASGWWWYYGTTATGLGDLLAQNSARLIDIEAYEVNGSVRYAAVMVPNTGSEAKAWWWYVGATTASISDALVQNNARLVDLETYLVDGSRRYAAVMIRNTGGDQRPWWWYYNVTPAEIASFLQANNARLIDIERHDENASRFSVVMVRNTEGVYWWWYYGLSQAELGERLTQNGARLIDIETYDVGRSKRFAAIMINNSNEITTRVGGILRGGTDGATGLYLKRAGGSVLASLQENRVFEPASTIKVVPHVYAMRRVQSGGSSLTDLVPIYQDISGSCPGDTIMGYESLSNALKQMMWNSDNERTKSVINTFGRQSINSMAQSIGMTSTSINHTLGCGAEAVADPNRLTLADAGLIYEGMADGTLLNETNRDIAYSLMAGKGYDFTGVWSELLQIIDEEAPYGMAGFEKQKFEQQIKLVYKAGGYTLPNGDPYLEYRSIAGWIEIPFCGRAGTFSQQYVFGIFIDGATDETAANATFNNAKAELLREQIRSALAGWMSCTARTYLPLLMREHGQVRTALAR